MALSALRCAGCEVCQPFLESVRRGLATGYAFDEGLASIAQDLLEHWRSRSEPQRGVTPAGTFEVAGALLGEAPAEDAYCLPAHAAASLYAAFSELRGYAWTVGRPDDEDTEIPQELVMQTQNTLISGLMLFGHNRMLDLSCAADWPVGAGELLEAREALMRACPAVRGSAEAGPEDARDEDRCTLGGIEGELRRGFARVASGRPLLPPMGGLRRPSPWTPRLEVPRVPRCLADAGIGHPACQVRVWYLGVHESLVKEAWHMWTNFVEGLHFTIYRLDSMGTYMQDPDWEGNKKRTRQQWRLEELQFKSASEDVYDMHTTVLRVREHFSTGEYLRGGRDFDADLLLCTIPAFACSAFADLKLPMVMYAANPATAQVPFAMQAAWLGMLAKMAADPKNRLLVSNPFAQAQFEYQIGVSLPVIRVHGLYTGVKRRPFSETGGEPSYQFLVYDRSTPLMSRALEALRREAAASWEVAGRARFVHHADTDQSYATFATFDAVVFVPGDVEQMGFYEFYSMGLPLWVPGDVGRFMHPWLPGLAPQIKSCGEYSLWMGEWEASLAEASLDSGVVVNLRIDCDGRVELRSSAREGARRGRLRELRTLVHASFSHCLDLGRPWAPSDDLAAERHFPMSLVHPLNMLRFVHVDDGGRCSNATGAGAVAGEMRYVADASRVPGTPTPTMPTVWDLEIFGSTAWYLHARAAGLGEPPTRHSSFRLKSFEATKEWAAYMDYFRFPAVGIFPSAAQLLAELLPPRGANATFEHLARRQRAMRAFNQRGLQRSKRQWTDVLAAIVAA